VLVSPAGIGYITNGVFGMNEKSFKEVSKRRPPPKPERFLKRFTPRAIELLAKRGVQAFPVGRSATRSRVSPRRRLLRQRTSRRVELIDVADP
jgi:hypothetical protein